MSIRLTISRSWALPALAAAVALIVVLGGAVAAVETETVATFPRGVWWCISLIATVGFIGDPPTTSVGAVLSVVLMVTGFFLIALVSASMASLFVRQDEATFEAAERSDVAGLLREIRELRAQVELLGGQAHEPVVARAADAGGNLGAGPSPRADGPRVPAGGLGQPADITDYTDLVLATAGVHKSWSPPLSRQRRRRW